MTGIPEQFYGPGYRRGGRGQGFVDIAAGRQPPEQEFSSTYGTLDEWRNLNRQRRDQQVRASVASALESDPDLVAEATRVGLDVNMDPRAVETDIEGFRKVQQRLAAERWQLSKGHPVLRQQMLDPTFARMAIDDLPQLGLIETFMASYEYGQAVAEFGEVAAEIRSNERLSDEDRRGFLEVQPSRARLMRAARRNPGGFIGGSGEFVGQMSVTVPRAIEAALAAGLTAAGTAFVAGQMGPQLFTPEELGTAPLAFFAAAAPVAATQQIWYDASQIEGGHLYADLIAEGIPHATAAPVSRVAGFVAGGLEVVGLGGVARATILPALRTARDRLLTQGAREAARRMATGGGFLAGGLEVAKAWGRGVAAETVTEGLQEVVGILGEAEARVREGRPSGLDAGEAVGRVADVMVKTAQGMTLLALPGPIVNVALQERHSADQAERDAAVTDKLSDALKGSKAAQRSPEAAAKLMQETANGTRAETTYVPGARFVEGLAQTSRSMEEFAAEFPDVAVQIPGAVASGGDVSIPSGIYNAKILNTPLGEALAQHTRLDANGRSLAEAEEVRQIQPDLDAAVTQELERTASFRQEAADVAEEFRQQTAGTRRVSRKVARATSRLYRAFVENQAAEAGMMPREWHRQFGVSVERGEAAEVAPEQLGQVDRELGDDIVSEETEKAGDRAGVAVKVGDVWHAAEPGEPNHVDVADRLGVELSEAADTEFGYFLRREGGEPEFFSDLEGVGRAAREARGEAPRPLEARQEGKVRAVFDPERRAITLLEGSDLTSVLHELSHGFLTFYGELAGQDGPRQSRALMEGFLEWREIEGGIEAWNAMSLDEQRPHHEAFAEWAEVYFQTGEAPTVALQRLFRNFRRWIVQLWRNVRGVVPEEVPEPVRQLLDRMLASQDAIDHAAAVRGLSQTFGPKPEGLSEAEWARIQQTNADAIESAVEYVTKRSVRDMQWLDNAKTGKLLEMQRKHRKLRKETRDEITEELEMDPVYRAWEFLRTGRFVDETGLVQEVEGPHKLRTAAVRDILGLTKRGRPKRLADMEILEAVVAVGGLRRSDALQLGDFADDIKRRVGVELVFPEGGKSLDAVQEALEENGDWRFEDQDALLEAIDAGLRGETVRSQFADVASLETAAAAEQEARTGVAAEPRGNLKSLMPGLTNPEGLEPDTVAEWFGFSSGREMVEEIVAAPRINEAVDQATDARMLREHGELVDAAAVRRAVNEGLAHPARARAMATQLKALQKTGVPVRAIVAGAREFAQETLSGTPVHLIKPWPYQGAEARARRDLMRALEKGDTEAAIRAQWAELAQHELGKEAGNAEKELADSRKLFRWFNQRDKKLSATREMDFVRAGRSLLRSVQVLPRAEGQTLRQEEKALTDLRQDFHNTSTDLAALADELGGEHYRKLTLEQYRNLVDMLQALKELSRSENVVRIGERRAETAKVGAEGAAAVEALPRRRAPGAAVPQGITPSEPAKQIQRLWEGLASSKRMFMWSRFMDGQKATGFFQDTFIRPMWDAIDQMRNHSERINAKMRDELRQLREFYGDRWDAHITMAADETASGQPFTIRGVRELYDLALDLGNLSNKQKRLVGEGWARHPRETGGVLDSSRFDRFWQRMVDEGLVTEELTDSAQVMWDEFESLRPEAQAVYRELLGYEFTEIPAVPFEAFGKEYAGGYAPIRPDPHRAEGTRFTKLTNFDDLEQGFEFSNYNVGVQKGFTIERNENAYYPMTLDISQRIQAFELELRYIYLARQIKNVQRVVREEQFSNALNAYDPAAIDETITPWLEVTAMQTALRPSGNRGVDAATRWMRQGASLAGLGFNLVSAAVQSTGLVTSAAGMRSRDLWYGVRTVAARPLAAPRMIAEKSSRMRRRFTIQARRIEQEISRQQYSKPWRTFVQARDEAGNAAHFLIRYAQSLVDAATWLGTYQRSIREAALGDGTREEMEAVEKQAIRDADLMVENTQGASDAEHTPKIEIGSPLWQLFFQFLTFPSTMLNNALGRAASAPDSPLQARAVLSFFAPILVLSFFEGAARASQEGLPDDEDDDGILNDLWWAYAGATARNITGMIPLVGPAAGTAINVALQQEGTVRTAAPAMAMFERILRVGVQGGDVKDVGRALTGVTKLPFHAIMDRLDFALDVEAGDVEPTSGFDYVRGLLTGRASEASR